MWRLAVICPSNFTLLRVQHTVQSMTQWKKFMYIRKNNIPKVSMFEIKEKLCSWLLNIANGKSAIDIYCIWLVNRRVSLPTRFIWYHCAGLIPRSSWLKLLQDSVEPGCYGCMGWLQVSLCRRLVFLSYFYTKFTYYFPSFYLFI